MKKSAQRRRKHGALLYSKAEPKIFSPPRRPVPRGAGPPKFNQLEIVTTFTYKPSLVRIDARNIELSETQKPTDRTDYNTLRRSLAHSVRSATANSSHLRIHLCQAASSYVQWSHKIFARPPLSPSARPTAMVKSDVNAMKSYYSSHEVFSPY